MISRHRVFTAYIISLLWLAAATLSFSLRHDGSLATLWMVLGLTGCCIVVYAGTWRGMCAIKLARAVSNPSLTQRYGLRITTLRGLVLLYMTLVVTHFYILHSIPFLCAIGSSSDIEISIVRQQGYFNLPPLLRYASDYSVKALGPALLLLTYYFRSRLFWVVLATGVIYSLGLFARVLPVYLFFPLLVYQIMQRRWLHSIGTFAIMIVILTSVTVIASVTLQDSLIKRQQHDLIGPNDWRRTSVLYALYERMLIVPGQVMHQWFQYYENLDEHERGCGYRWLAPILGCTYVHIPSKLYNFYHQENANQGMMGSLNSASFMTEYANFGPRGFILSALFAGLLFSVIMLIYGNHPLALPMNLPFIISAMETSVFTALHSGAGWLAMTLIFILFFRFPINEQQRNHAAISTVQPLPNGHVRPQNRL